MNYNKSLIFLPLSSSVSFEKLIILLSRKIDLCFRWEIKKKHVSIILHYSGLIAAKIKYMSSFFTPWTGPSKACLYCLLLMQQIYDKLTHCRLNRFSHNIYWKSPISILGTSGCEIYIFLGKNDLTVCKQWRPWSDAAFCGVWSGSALFANYPFTGLPTIQWVKRKQSGVNYIFGQVNVKEVNKLWCPFTADTYPKYLISFCLSKKCRHRPDTALYAADPLHPLIDSKCSYCFRAF